MGSLCTRKASDIEARVEGVTLNNSVRASDAPVQVVPSKGSAGSDTEDASSTRTKELVLPADDRKKRLHSQSSTASWLDSAASESLKRFAERNRPQTGPGVWAAGAPVVASKSDAHFYRPGASRSSLPIGGVDDGDSLEQTSENVAFSRYDIFDDVDEDRLKEFEEIIEKIKQKSNYAEHTKRAKRHNKFSTCAGVTENEETGMTVLS
mmetsp:Transcript_72494/g.172829  ORF Transcript_72494/g.172829 Transcript_72494/m.172829 type:complete len:208 (-) Transcript_72494:64-687(-)